MPYYQRRTFIRAVWDSRSSLGNESKIVSDGPVIPSNGQNKEYFTNLVVRELERRYAELAKAWREHASNNDVLINMTRAALTLDTFLAAGYGSCGRLHPELERPVQAWHAAVRVHLEKGESMVQAPSLQALIELRNDLADLLANLPPPPKPDVQKTNECSLGMGDQPRWHGMFTLASLYPALDPGNRCTLVDNLSVPTNAQP